MHCPQPPAHPPALTPSRPKVYPAVDWADTSNQKPAAKYLLSGVSWPRDQGPLRRAMHVMSCHARWPPACARHLCALLRTTHAAPPAQQHVLLACLQRTGFNTILDGAALARAR
jgi:hypothetical protein